MIGGSRQKHAGVSPFAVLKYVRLGEFRRARGHEEMRQLFKPGGEGEDEEGAGGRQPAQKAHKASPSKATSATAS